MTYLDRINDARELALAKAAAKSTRKGFKRTGYAKLVAREDQHAREDAVAAAERIINGR